MTGSSNRSGSISRRVALSTAGVLALALAYTSGWRAWRGARAEEAFQRAVADARAGQVGPAAEAVAALRRIDPDDRRVPAAEGEVEQMRHCMPSCVPAGSGPAAISDLVRSTLTNCPLKAFGHFVVSLVRSQQSPTESGGKLEVE